MLAARRRIVSSLLILMLMVVFSPIALAQGVTVIASENPDRGNILTDSHGKTLYVFLRDKPNVSSACYNRCATIWPPLLISEDNPIAGSGANGNLLGVLVRTDGTRQVMYNGWPLYYYATDTKPGDTTGQGVGKVWFVLNLDASGTPAQLPAAPPPAAPAPAAAAPAPAPAAPAAPAPAGGTAGAPAQLPRTGGRDAPLQLIVLIALALVCAGALLSVRGWRRKA